MKFSAASPWAANPAIALRLQSTRPVGRVVELGVVRRHHTHMKIDPKRCFRNLAIAGGGAVAVDLLIPRPGLWELTLQTVLVFVCGLIGLFRHGGDE